jgi:hypothetical protein
MPSSKNYKRDYQREKETDRKRGGIKKRAQRNAARRKMMKAGKVKKGDGKDVAHKDNNTRNNSKKNLSVQSKKKNRSFPRNKKAGRK